MSRISKWANNFVSELFFFNKIGGEIVMKNLYLPAISITVVLIGFILIFGVQPTNAVGLPLIDLYVQGTYNFEFEEVGARVGAKFDTLPLLSLQLDGTYYFNDFYAIRGSGAYNVFPIPGPLLDVRLMGGVGYYSNGVSGFDGHVGLQIEQGTGTGIDLMADVIVMPGIISNLDSHVEVAGGLSLDF